MKYTGCDSDVLLLSFQLVFGLVKGSCLIKFINQITQLRAGKVWKWTWSTFETNIRNRFHPGSRPPEIFVFRLPFTVSCYLSMLRPETPQLPVCGVRLLLLVCLWWCWWAVLVAGTVVGSSPTCLTISHRSWRRMEGMKVGAAEHGVAWEQTGEEVALLLPMN